jgi:hypothetical protein
VLTQKVAIEFDVLPCVTYQVERHRVLPPTGSPQRQPETCAIIVYIAMETLSDLVRDWRLECIISNNHTVQTRHISNAAEGIWRKRVEERWRHTQELGRGSFGIVRLEECISGQSSGQLRAVKELRKNDRSMPVAYYSKELDAIFKFSHEHVRLGWAF